jgi:tetratricopeptide (TPR) repeat protein
MSMNLQNYYTDLETLVKKEKFNEAKQAINTAIASGQDIEFWKTQLAYASFLNEKNDSDHYVKVAELFTSLVETNPKNGNSYFWLGYVTYILFGQTEIARNHLNKAKEIEPNLFYANLVLAGFPLNAKERLNLLETVIEQKPNLFRALLDEAMILIKLDQYDKAKHVLNRLLNLEPYVEKHYGIMNAYMNDVFTGANHYETLRKQAEAEIKLLG